MAVQFYLGGARSGKSGIAEQEALELLQDRRVFNSQTRLHYIATAEPFDDEMKERIALHQQRRDEQWVNHECPLQLAQKIAQFTEHDIVLIDCLTVWLNNVLYHLTDSAESHNIREKVSELKLALSQTEATVLCVATEVGLGIVPMNALTRRYVDHAGWMNQAVARIADQVEFVVAGLPMRLKG